MNIFTTRKIIIILFLIILIVATVFGYLNFFKLKESKAITGKIENIYGNTIYIKGNYIYDDDSTSEEKDFVIQTTSQTEFTKIVVSRPALDELMKLKTNSKLDITPVKGSISDLNLTALYNVQITSERNIKVATPSTASLVVYTILEKQ